jgi:hypothetical protein
MVRRKDDDKTPLIIAGFLLGGTALAGLTWALIAMQNGEDGGDGNGDGDGDGEVPHITGVNFDFNTVTYPGPDDSHIHALTQGSGVVYHAFSNGNGWNDGGPRIALGFARLSGNPPNIDGTHTNDTLWRSPTSTHPGANKQIHGLLHVGNNTVYGWLDTRDGNPSNTALPDRELWESTDNTNTWHYAGVRYTNGSDGPFGGPVERISPMTFVNFGDGPENVVDGFIYMIGGDWGGEGHTPEDEFMIRVPLTQIKQRSAYQWFAGLDGSGNPIWGPESGRRPFIRNVGAKEHHDVTKTQIFYIFGIQQFLLTHWQDGSGALRISIANHPWGPYRTIYETRTFGGMQSTGGLFCEGLTMCFPKKWQSADGLTLWASFSVWGNECAEKGIAGHDRLGLVRCQLQVAG